MALIPLEVGEDFRFYVVLETIDLTGIVLGLIGIVILLRLPKALLFSLWT